MSKKPQITGFIVDPSMHPLTAAYRCWLLRDPKRGRPFSQSVFQSHLENASALSMLPVSEILSLYRKLKTLDLLFRWPPEAPVERWAGATPLCKICPSLGDRVRLCFFHLFGVSLLVTLIAERKVRPLLRRVLSKINRFLGDGCFAHTQ